MGPSWVCFQMVWIYAEVVAAVTLGMHKVFMFYDERTYVTKNQFYKLLGVLLIGKVTVSYMVK